MEEATQRAAEIEVHIAGLEADGEPVPEEHEPPRLVTVTVAARHSAVKNFFQLDRETSRRRTDICAPDRLGISLIAFAESV